MGRAYRWFRRRYRKMGLATKIVVNLTVIILIPALILAGIWTKNESQQVYERAYLQGFGTVERVTADMAAGCVLIENTVLAALSQRDFLSFCDGDMYADGLKLVKFSQTELRNMNYIIQSNSLIDSASFYFFNEQLYEIWDTIYSYDRFQNPEFMARLHEARGSVFLANGVTEQAQGYVSCYREVYLDTTLIGVLEIRVRPEDFFAQIIEENEIASREGSGQIQGVTLLVDGESRELIYPEQMQEIPTSLLERLSGQIKQTPSRANFSLSTDDGRYFGVYQYMEEMDLYAVHLVSEESLTGGIYRSVATILLALILILALLYLVATSVYRRMLVRLRLLTASMRQVQEGDLQVRVEEVADGDELDELGCHFNSMLSRIEGLIEENVTRQTAAVEAELNALQSQINSHFLYNALESIRMMAEIRGETELADTIVSLGSLLRYHMSWKTKTVALREEIESIRRYVYFVNMIYEFDVQLTVRLTEEQLNTDIPRLCLQPLVENSVVHGMVPGSRSLHITISAVENGKVLVLQVLDDGAGISKERMKLLEEALYGRAHESLKIGRNGIGIVNVHRRLQMNYGNEYGLVLQSEENTYTLVKVVMPYERKELGGW